MAALRGEDSANAAPDSNFEFRVDGSGLSADSIVGGLGFRVQD